MNFDVRRDNSAQISFNVRIAFFEDQKLIDGLKQVKDRGRTLGIIGTPNFFIDGKLVKKVIGVPELRQLLDAALAGRG